MSVEHGALYFFHEHALPTDHVKWHIEPDVTHGLDLDELHALAGCGNDGVRNGCGLSKRLARSARGQPQRW